MAENVHGESKRWRWLVLWLVVCVVLVFVPVCGHEFVEWDDQENLAGNVHMLDASLSGMGYYWTHAEADLYVPVTYTVWMAVAEVAWMAGTNEVELISYVFHGLNLALHAGSAVMVFLILRRVLKADREGEWGRDWGAFFGALLFGVHPLQVEAVAWASGMKDVLSGLLSLVAVWEYLKYSEAGDVRGRRKAYGVGALVYVLAMLAKPQAVIVPLVAGVLDVWVLKRHWREVGKGVMGWLVLAVPVVVVARLVQPATDAYKPALWMRPVVALDALAFYAGQLAAPVWLSMDYGRSPKWLLEGAGSGAKYWTWMVPVAIGAVVVAVRKRWAWPLAGAGVFVAGVLPVLGLAAFDFQYCSTVADHYVYVAMLGPAVVLGWAMARWRGRLMTVCVVAVLAGLGVRSHMRTYDWRDSATLFAATLRVNPLSVAANMNLGGIYAERAYWAPTPEEKKALFDQALAYYERALGVGTLDRDAHENIARVHDLQGRFAEAAAHYRAAIEKHPAAEAVMHLRLGTALMKLGQLEEAGGEFRRALALAKAEDPVRSVAAEKLGELEELKREGGAGVSDP